MGRVPAFWEEQPISGAVVYGWTGLGLSFAFGGMVMLLGAGRPLLAACWLLLCGAAFLAVCAWLLAFPQAATARRLRAGTAFGTRPLTAFDQLLAASCVGSCISFALAAGILVPPWFRLLFSVPAILAVSTLAWGVLAYGRLRSRPRGS
ncbi:MAG: hypothetical protein QOG31_586 [Thermoplasmata archaeon]|jgi:hypothetical protein|nr:hypothetical protein [Thermoplasmata archaeon]